MLFYIFRSTKLNLKKHVCPLKNYLFNNKIPHHDSRIFEIIISVFYLSPLFVLSIASLLFLFYFVFRRFCCHDHHQCCCSVLVCHEVQIENVHEQHIIDYCLAISKYKNVSRCGLVSMNMPLYGYKTGRRYSICKRWFFIN